jgi:dihydrolipoamide dehydrogenase
MERAAEVSREVQRRLEAAGVTVFYGEPLFIAPRIIEIGDGHGGAPVTLEADRVVVATGTSPAAPAGFSFDTPGIISHRELLFLPRRPESLVILGGNVEGIELACLYAGLGTRVTVVEQEALLLPGNDRDLTSPVLASLEKAGVKFLTGIRVEAAGPVSSGKDGSFVSESPVEVILSDSAGTLRADYLVITGFRRPSLPAGWEAVGGTASPTGIPVNRRFQTSLEEVYAVGDVNGIMGMAHAAIHQASHLPRVWRGEEVRQEYPLLPRTIFTVPEIAGVGVQEGDKPASGEPYRVTRVNFSRTWRGFYRGEEGFIKLIFDRDERLRGIWAVGRDVTEMMSFAAPVVKAAPRREELLDTLFIHPSLGEAVREALEG